MLRRDSPERGVPSFEWQLALARSPHASAVTIETSSRSTRQPFKIIRARSIIFGKRSAGTAPGPFAVDTM